MRSLFIKNDNRKGWFRLILVLVLLVSHGVVLAHGGDHLTEQGTELCDVCCAGQAFSAMGVAPGCQATFLESVFVYTVVEGHSALPAPSYSDSNPRAPPHIPSSD